MLILISRGSRGRLGIFQVGAALQHRRVAERGTAAAERLPWREEGVNPHMLMRSFLFSQRFRALEPEKSSYSANANNSDKHCWLICVFSLFPWAIDLKSVRSDVFRCALSDGRHARSARRTKASEMYRTPPMQGVFLQHSSKTLRRICILTR